MHVFVQMSVCQYASMHMCDRIFCVTIRCTSVAQQAVRVLMSISIYSNHQRALVKSETLRNFQFDMLIYALQQDTRSVLMSEFVHHVC